MDDPLIDFVDINGNALDAGSEHLYSAFTQT